MPVIVRVLHACVMSWIIDANGGFNGWFFLRGRAVSMAIVNRVPLAPAGWAGAFYDTDVPLRWGDLDALNHLNNTVYFRLMEEARFQLLFASGLRLPGAQGPILAHASCDFLKALTYPAMTRVRQTVTRLGRSSIDLDVTIERSSEPGRLYAQGRNVLVWFDYDCERLAPWPAEALVLLWEKLTVPI